MGKSWNKLHFRETLWGKVGKTTFERNTVGKRWNKLHFRETQWGKSVKLHLKETQWGKVDIN